MGLRLVEATDKFPDPTPEELKFFQLSFGSPLADLKLSTMRFKAWILVKGLGDLQKCIRTTLERLLVFRTIELKLQAKDKIDIERCEEELRHKANKSNYPDLIEQINSLFDEPLRYQDELGSFNNARNCLEHDNGIVGEKRCNNKEKNKLIIHGSRFKIFFKTAREEVPAELGKAGPENAALMLGAEGFQIEFALGQSVELSLKQFIDILNTCVFVRADIESKLSPGRP